VISVTDKPDKDTIDTQTLSILPLKGTVVYPYLVVPLMIQDADQTRMLDETLMRGARIGLFLQKDLEQENPGPDDLHSIGTAGNILKMLRFPDCRVSGSRNLSRPIRI
jgi:ATP-dependent Lon protease